MQPQSPHRGSVDGLMHPQSPHRGSIGGSPVSPGGASPFSHHPHQYPLGYDQRITLSKADARDWQRTTARIDTFVEGSQDDSQLPSGDISKSHWKKSSEQSNCSHSKCRKKFGPLYLRKHHCRKCGGIFCGQCLRYRRRLSPLAEYDPNGKFYQVCEVCYNADTQTIGKTTSLTKSFFIARSKFQAQVNSNALVQGNPTKTILQQECARLVDGYRRHSVSHTSDPQDQTDNSKPKSGGLFGFGLFTPKVLIPKSPIAKLPTSRSITGIPDWQKPVTWMSAGTECKVCDTPYSRLDKYHNCRICGRLVCLNCSDRKLLLYVPDACDRERLGNQPRWAIIAIVGCPEVEPDKHLYLRACHPCREKLETLQVEAYQESLQEADDTADCMARMVHMQRNIVAVQQKLDTALPEYKQLIDGMEIEPESPKSLPSQRSNMQLLAKHQGDLSDNFTKFVVMVGRLKKLKPQSSTQVKLVKSLISCKFSFYSENMYQFRQLKKRLAQISPPEVLQEIQEMVDSEAINSACLCIGQLAFESLHLCTKYGMDVQLSLAMKGAAEICEEDLKENVEMRGKETWEEHKYALDTFIKNQLSEKKRWYVRPSRSRSSYYGKVYVSDFLMRRSEEVIGQINLQLRTRCADRQFYKSKEALGQLKETLERATKSQEANNQLPW